MKNNSCISSAVVTFLGLLSVSSLVATDGVYNSNLLSGVWENSDNWLNGDIANGEGAVADVVIDYAGNHILEFSGDITLGVLNIGNISTSTSGNFTFRSTVGSGAWLHMNNGDEMAVITRNPSLASIAATIDTNIAIYKNGLRIAGAPGVRALNVGSAGYTIQNQDVDGGFAWLAVANGGGQVLAVNAKIDDGWGTVGVRVEEGVVSLGGQDNNFTGGIVVQGGQLRGSNASLAGNTIYLGNADTGGATTRFGAVLSETIVNDIVVAAGPSGAATLQGEFHPSDLVKTVTYSGNISLGRNLSITTLIGVEVTGSISGSGQLHLGATNSFSNRYITLSGNNTHSGGTFLTMGNVRYNLGHASAPGTGILGIGTPTGTTHSSAVEIDNTSGAAMRLGNNNVLRLANFSFVGTDDLHMGDGAVTIGPSVAVVNVQDKKLTIGGVISGANKSFGNAGAGRLVLEELNTYTGRTTVGGILSVTSLANGGVASHIGQSTNSAANLVLNRGTLEYTGSGVATDRLFTLGYGGGAIESSGTGALVFGNTGAVALTQGGISVTLPANASSYASGSTIIHVSNSSSFTTADLAVGMSVSGGAIPPGSVITAILDGGRIEISNPTTGTHPGAPNNVISFGGLSHRELVLKGTNTNDNELAASLSDAGDGTVGLRKTGSGKWVLTGTHSYTGTTTVEAGTLVVGSAGALNSSTVAVVTGGRFVHNSSVARTGGIDLQGSAGGRAILSGGGLFDVALALNHIGDTLSPGEDIGTMTFAVDQSWASFTYEFDLANFTGLVGGSDFDRILIQGSLDLTGGSGDYVLDLRSLTALFETGPVENFTEGGGSWTILSAESGINGFVAGNWTILTDRFDAGETPIGHWWLSQSGGDLLLNYGAIPEPSTYIMMMGSVGALWMAYRRRV